MSRCYLDANFLYTHLRTPRAGAPSAVEGWRAAVLAELSDGDGVISALVQDELAYRLILAWLRDDGVRDPLSAYRTDPRGAMRSVKARLAKAWRAVDSLALELQPTDLAVVEQARALMASPGLSPRDAFHAAHALAASCQLVASSDPAFDLVKGLERLSP